MQDCLLPVAVTVRVFAFLGERQGDIIELETGKKIGTHRGYWFHTIGQRKGLGLSGGPWFVIRKDVEANVLYVSRGYDTQWQYGREFKIHDFHFITENPWLHNQEVDVTFKIRHTPEFMKGKLIREGEIYRIVSSENFPNMYRQWRDWYLNSLFIYSIPLNPQFLPS